MMTHSTTILRYFLCISAAVLLFCGCRKTPEERLSYLAVQLPDEDNWSIIDRDGNVLAKNEYPADATISYISSDVYWVQLGEKYQLFNVAHPKKPVIDEEFVAVTNFFQTDRAAVSSNFGKPIRIIDSSGKTIATLPENIALCYPFSIDGYAVYSDANYNQGIIDRDGNIVVKASYVKIVGFHEGLSLAQKRYDDGKYLILNKKGDQIGTINSCQYEPVNGSYHEGKLIVKDASSNTPRYHALNPKGELIFTFDSRVAEIETSACYMNGYLVFIGSNGLSGILNNKGEIVVQAKYTGLINYGKGQFAAMRDNRWGVINAKDEIIIPIVYDNCLQTAMGDNFIMMQGDTYILLSPDGKEGLRFCGFQANINLFAQHLSNSDSFAASNSNDDPGMEDDMEGYGTYGLMAALPQGTIVYTGDMGGYPIEFTITNNPKNGELSAIYKNVNYGTTMKMFGESLPADDGAISFLGEENGRQWRFELDGDANNINGTAFGSNNWQFTVKLKRK